MTQIPWLEPDSEFPPPEQALDSPNGLLAAGSELTPERLLLAYQSGIFPWYEDGQPLLWWSPDPRTILRPENIKISRSLRKRLRRGEFEVFVNRDFRTVIEACAAPRDYTDGTWITEEMQDAYVKLNKQGHCHSIECYRADELVGGLYGISVGNMFCGESMFHTVTDASKVAFAHLARLMQDANSHIIDCQLENDHLMSLGCEPISRATYLHALKAALGEPSPSWLTRQLVYDWNKPILKP